MVQHCSNVYSEPKVREKKKKITSIYDGGKIKIDEIRTMSN